MKVVSTCLALATLAVAAHTSQPKAQEPSAELLAVVEARSETERARDAFRHPAQTLAFFQIAPGMTVAEALPGSGWYTRILANYLGSEGTLYGINYVERMWPMFSFATEDWITKKIDSTGKFKSDVRGFTDNGISAEGFTFNTIPPAASGQVDLLLMIRALHNLNRFEAQAGTRTQAMAAVRGLLKPGGLVGVVQHRLPESAAEDGADGSRGYLKQSRVIEIFTEAGFELVAQSEINANPKDKPGPGDSVWRLPPSLNTSKDDPELRAKLQAVGESDRMTLLFRKKE